MAIFWKCKINRLFSEQGVYLMWILPLQSRGVGGAGRAKKIFDCFPRLLGLKNYSTSKITRPQKWLDPKNYSTSKIYSTSKNTPQTFVGTVFKRWLCFFIYPIINGANNNDAGLPYFFWGGEGWGGILKIQIWNSLFICLQHLFFVNPLPLFFFSLIFFKP